MPEPTTRSQRWAERACQCIQARSAEHGYKSFAQRVPALIQQCGLAQALAFALAKGHASFVEDLAFVLRGEPGGAPQLAVDARTVPLTAYLRLSQQALAAGEWLKRYAEALLKDDQP